MASPIAVDERKQLFLDDYLIDSMDNVVRKLHPAEKHASNPLISPNEEWEGNKVLTHGSVIRDGDKYRAWYLSAKGVSYAESNDGINWTKPGLDLFEVDGQKTNLVIEKRAEDDVPNKMPNFYNILGVMKDEREKDPSRRYKMGFVSIQRDYKGPHEDLFHSGQRRGLGVACSPDGYNWTLVDNWSTESICDGPGHWMLDPSSGKYVFYGRTKFVAPQVAEMWAQDEWCKKNCWGRSVIRIESPDFINWDTTGRGEGELVLTPDEHDPLGTEFYSMMVFPYEGIYIGLIQIFHNQPDECYLDVQLAVSRDSHNFTRVGDRSTFIPVGEVGSWDRFNNSIANNPPIEIDDRLYFYYSGRTYRHGPYEGPDHGVSAGRIGVASIQRDRFVSLGSSFDSGLIVTKPLQLKCY